MRSPTSSARERQLRRGRPARRRRARAHPRSRARDTTDGSTCSSTTPAPPGARASPTGGYENVRRTMAINFDAQVRLTEALLPLLRSSAPSAIVNVASTAARVARAGTGAYSASKFALAGWSDALWAEERAHGVHVGLVLPGFISTEGFPQSELTAKPWTRWIVSTPERAAEAIYDAGIGRRAERYVPRAYALAAAARILAPGLVRRVLGGSRRRRHDDHHRARPRRAAQRHRRAALVRPAGPRTARTPRPAGRRRPRSWRSRCRSARRSSSRRARSACASACSTSSTPKYTSQFGGDGGVSSRMPPLFASPFLIVR